MVFLNEKDGDYMGGFVPVLLGAAAMKKAAKAPSVQTTQAETAAQPAAEAAAPPQTAETNADSPSTVLKKKAKGKSSLTISTGSSSGGTGLNI